MSDKKTQLENHLLADTKLQFVLDPLATTHKVMWEDLMAYHSLFWGKKIFDCQNGKGRKKVWKRKREEMKLQVWFTQ